MSYTPRPPAPTNRLGYVRAQATTNTTDVTTLNFNQYTPANINQTSLCIMRISRSDDAAGQGRWWFNIDGTSDPEKSGCINDVTTKYFHSPPEAVGYVSSLSMVQVHREPATGKDFDATDWSHVMYWRAN